MKSTKTKAKAPTAGKRGTSSAQNTGDAVSRLGESAVAAYKSVTETVEAFKEAQRSLKPAVNEVKKIAGPAMKSVKHYANPALKQMKKTARKVIRKAEDAMHSATDSAKSLVGMKTATKAAPKKKAVAKAVAKKKAPAINKAR